MAPQLRHNLQTQIEKTNDGWSREEFSEYNCMNVNDQIIWRLDMWKMQ